VDNRGLVLMVRVTTAGVHDSIPAKELLLRLALTHPQISVVRADSAYGQKLLTWAKKYLDITIKTVRRPPDAKGFVILARRWVVERSWP
jgi:transposase